MGPTAASHLYLALALLPEICGLIFTGGGRWAVGTVNCSVLAKLQFQYQEPVGEKRQETTKYYPIAPRLEAFKGCPE